MLLSLLSCLAALLVLLWYLRYTGASFGLPLGYLISLLVIHVPGAFAHYVSRGILVDDDVAALGIQLTAIGAVSFVVGVVISHWSQGQKSESMTPISMTFCIFCFAGGWMVTLVSGALETVPSLGAAVVRASVIWMLGVALGLRTAWQSNNISWILLWSCALLIYPMFGLFFTGFLAAGMTMVIIVSSALAMVMRGYWRMVIGLGVATFFGMTAFVNYYANRDEIRNSVWGGESLTQRLDSAAGLVTEFKWFDSEDPAHLIALDERLNQNYFVGIAAQRIDLGIVDYLYGRSVWEGIIALVPRFLWPDKPVFGGSPKIVVDMTGLELEEENTSFGVGNVMEFDINFGIPGVIAGFLVLGWLIGRLDLMTAMAEARRDYGALMLGFLPGVALIQPNGSMVELTGGAAAAVVAAYGWRWVWGFWHASYRPALR